LRVRWQIGKVAFSFALLELPFKVVKFACLRDDCRLRDSSRLRHLFPFVRQFGNRRVERGNMFAANCQLFQGCLLLPDSVSGTLNDVAAQCPRVLLL